MCPMLGCVDHRDLWESQRQTHLGQAWTRRWMQWLFRQNITYIRQQQHGHIIIIGIILERVNQAWIARRHTAAVGPGAVPTAN